MADYFLRACLFLARIPHSLCLLSTHPHVHSTIKRAKRRNYINCNLFAKLMFVFVHLANPPQDDLLE